MAKILRPGFWLVVGLMTVLGTSVSQARPGVIQDNAGFFSERAKTEAARNIGEMEKSLKKDLVIETFATLPGELQAGVNPADKAAMGRVYETWAARQAKLNAVNGVYILLVKNPAHLQVAVGNDTQKQAFTLQDRDTLVGIMLGKLREKKADEALLAGVNFVSTTMSSHLAGRQRVATTAGTQVERAGTAQTRTHAAKPAESGLAGWIPVVIGIVAIWVVFGIIRSLFRGGAGGGNPGMSQAGGGGFLSSLMGGMFGAAAGMWMYDQFFNHNASASLHDNNPADGGDSGYSGQDSDYSSSGDNFDNNNSDGGGSGWGDSGGGGDFGGGDSGGGGDF